MSLNLTDYPWKNITENADHTYLDFSVNTNALGIPNAVKEYIAATVEFAGGYPDPECRQLTECLSEKYKIPASHILCGNGADDLLYRFVLAIKPKRAIIVEPAFEEYQRALHLVGCDVLHYTLKAEKGFTLDEDILKVIKPDVDVLFLCNPNNPTGQVASRALVKKILDRCAAHNVILVVDECFMEFLPEWGCYSVKSLAAQYENSVVIDAFTKTYSLAGFRLGFCISGNADLLAGMRLQGQSFSVSTLSQFAGVCALMDDAYMQETYRSLPAEREWLFRELKKLPMEVFPSQGNFLLCKNTAVNMRQALMEKGIKVRDCSQFYGLSWEYFRIAVGKHRDNELLIKALRGILL